MSLPRRTLLIATAALAGGTTTTRLSFAAGGSLVLALAQPERLKGLTGEALRRGLLGALSLRSEGGAMPVQLLAVRMQRGRLVDVFVSETFKHGGPGRTALARALPSDSYFPGDMLFPGDMFFPGDMLFPGNMFRPGDAPLDSGRAGELLQQQARQAMGREANGLFFVATAAQADTTSQGLGVGLQAS